jgi:acyl-CoA thioesterase I
MQLHLKNSFASLLAGDPLTVVAFGDSITEGYDVAHSYVHYWEAAMRNRFPAAPLRVVNAGCSGDTTFDAVRRMRQDVVAYAPHLVFVQFGINDCFSAVYRSEFRENLLWIIRRLSEETSADILLMTSVLLRETRDREALERFYDVICEFAAEHSLGLFRMDILWRDAMRNGPQFDQLILPDGAHPSDDGHRHIADALIKLFVAGVNALAKNTTSA